MLVLRTQLFGGHAPSLVHLSISDSSPVDTQFSALLKNTSNLRHLELNQSLQLSVSDLFNVLSHTPSLEVLKLDISKLVYSSENENSVLRLHMPRLKLSYQKPAD